MNREEITRMAREAGFVVDEASRQHQPKCIGFTHYLIDDELERFAAIVAAAEREACAMRAWSTVLAESDTEMADIVLRSIRARGEK